MYPVYKTHTLTPPPPSHLVQHLVYCDGQPDASKKTTLRTQRQHCLYTFYSLHIFKKSCSKLSWNFLHLGEVGYHKGAQDILPTSWGRDTYACLVPFFRTGLGEGVPSKYKALFGPLWRWGTHAFATKSGNSCCLAQRTQEGRKLSVLLYCSLL